MTLDRFVDPPHPPSGQPVEGLYRLIADHASDAVLCVGLDGQMRYASPAFCKITGWSIEATLAFNHRALVHPDERLTVSQILDSLQAGELGASCRYRYVRPDGSYVWVEACFQVASGQYGLGAGYAGSIRDITDRKHLEEQLAAAQAELARVSATDSLTQLLSRGRFNDALAAEWARGGRDEQPLSLLLLEIDYLEAYTSLYGPQARDEVLRIAAACVRGRLHRTTDLVSRYREEAFAVLMPHTDGFGAMAMADRVRDAVLDRNLPHTRSPHGIVSVSLGAATVIPAQGSLPVALTNKAEQALGEARRLGRNRIEADAAVVVAAATAGGWFDGSRQDFQGKP
jgi:diguanylate cyclase (GGDEF)-like protein/PAS domain S-box-containing protein